MFNIDTYIGINTVNSIILLSYTTPTDIKYKMFYTILLVCTVYWWVASSLPGLTLIFLSWISEHDLDKKALAQWRISRNKVFDTNDTSCEEYFISAGGPNFKEDTSGTFPEDIMNEFVEPPKKWGHRDRDSEHMRRFLEDAQEAGFPDIESDLANYMPGGVPAVYHAHLNRQLSNETEHGGWQFPELERLSLIKEHAGISRNPGDIAFSEITLGDPESLPFIMFVEQHFAADLRKMPAAVLSFDTEDVQIPVKHYKYLCDWTKLTPEEQKEPYYGKVKTDGKKINIPARIIIGNGITWMASIRFPWHIKSKDGKKYWVLKPCKQDVQLLLEYIWRNRMVCGSGIIRDVKELHDFILTVYGIDLKMPVPIEMNALAVAAGYRFPRTKLWFLQLIICGGVHNKLVSCADNSWWLPWDDLPSVFRAYALADVRHGYQCFVVLMTLLINNLFPDPVPVGEFLSMNQERTMEYLCQLICATLANKEVYRPAYEAAVTRWDLLKCLHGHKQKHLGTPEEIQAMAECLPPWPTVCYGNARDFHTVAAVFAGHQADKLVAWRESLPTPRNSKIHIYTRTEKITEQEVKSINFNRNSIPAKISKKYADTDSNSVLNHKLEFEQEMFKITDLKQSTIMGEVERTGQPLVTGMLEWFRSLPIAKCTLTLIQIGLLGKELEGEDYKGIWVKKPVIYQKLKNQLYLRTNKLMETCHFLEDVIAGKTKKVLDQEKAREDKLKEVMEYNAERKLKMEADAQSKGRLQTKKDLQGKHYAKHPSTASERTMKRRYRHNKTMDKLRGSGVTIKKKPRQRFRAKDRLYGKKHEGADHKEADHKGADHPQEDTEQSPQQSQYDDHGQNHQGLEQWSPESEKSYDRWLYQESQENWSDSYRRDNNSTLNYHDRVLTYHRSERRSRNQLLDYDYNYSKGYPSPERSDRRMRYDHSQDRQGPEQWSDYPSRSDHSQDQYRPERRSRNQQTGYDRSQGYYSPERRPRSPRYRSESFSREARHGSPKPSGSGQQEQDEYYTIGDMETEISAHYRGPRIKMARMPNRFRESWDEKAQMNMSPRPEENFDPIPSTSNTGHTGYSDISDVDMDITCIIPGKGKGKGKGKKSKK